jgi:putative membrane protein
MAVLVRALLIVAAAAAAWLLRDQLGDLRSTLAGVGWRGLLAMAAYHPMAITLCGVAWWELSRESPPATFIVARWIRDAVSELASFLPLAGEMTGARILTRRGIRTATAGALTVVDVTAEVIAQFLFSLAGLALWLTRHPTGDVVHWALVGLVASIPILVAFVAAQRSGLMRLLETLPSRLMPKVWSAPDADRGVHAGITVLWADRRRVGLAVAIHTTAWTVSAGEAWLALHLLGHPLPIADVIGMECIIFALKSAAFFVPAALGVQEGGYLLLAGVLGLPPEIALSISLLKRGRAIVLGVPALLVWQFIEGRTVRAVRAR